MSIVNYDHLAKTKLKKFLEDKDISDINKEYVRKFLDQYEVSSARKAIFFERIIFLSRAIPDIKKELDNKDLVNKVFNKFRESMGLSSYATLVNISLRFVTWLNDGSKPRGYVDIKRPPKIKQKRDLNPNDMITWEDGKCLAALCMSIQWKALILTQLDCGFRPSELLDLNYGDVDIKKDLVVFHVRSGKTGKRDVIAQRSAPAFLTWYKNHPTKKKDDPLWMLEFNDRTKKGFSVRRYTYAALNKRLKLLFEKAEINKPSDLYNFRHSSCVLDKKDNLPLELASDRHGHSTLHFTQTYGRLNIDDVAQRYRLHYGQIEDKHKLEKNILCESCGFINEPNKKDCEQCHRPLTLERALNNEKRMEDAIVNSIYKKLKEKVSVRK